MSLVYFRGGVTVQPVCLSVFIWYQGFLLVFQPLPRWKRLVEWLGVLGDIFTLYYSYIGQLQRMPRDRASNGGRCYTSADEQVFFRVPHGHVTDKWPSVSMDAEGDVARNHCRLHLEVGRDSLELIWWWLFQTGARSVKDSASSIRPCWKLQWRCGIPTRNFGANFAFQCIVRLFLSRKRHCIIFKLLFLCIFDGIFKLNGCSID